MKKTVLIVLLFGLMAPEGLRAQKMYIDNGMVILDMSTTGIGIGMNPGSVTNVAKTFNNYTPNASGYLDGSTSSAYSLSQDEKVFQKLEIAPSDMTNSGTLTSGVSDAMTWVNAFTRCRDLTYNGRTGWRLPTRRELQMMWIFLLPINSLSGSLSGDSFDPSIYYWCATESGSNSAWSVYFVDGSAPSTNGRTLSFKVRCVREVTP